MGAREGAIDRLDGALAGLGLEPVGLEEPAVRAPP